MEEPIGKYPCKFSFLDIVKMKYKKKFINVQIIGVVFDFHSEDEQYYPKYYVHGMNDEFYFKKVDEDKLFEGIDDDDMEEELIQYVDNNFNSLVFDLQYTYSQMCMNKTDLMGENERLYEHISNLIEDFVIDNELEEDWAEDFGIDVQNVFEKLLNRNYIK